MRAVILPSYFSGTRTQWCNLIPSPSLCIYIAAQIIADQEQLPLRCNLFSASSCVLSSVFCWLSFCPLPSCPVLKLLIHSGPNFGPKLVIYSGPNFGNYRPRQAGRSYQSIPSGVSVVPAYSKIEIRCSLFFMSRETLKWGWNMLSIAWIHCHT